MCDVLVRSKCMYVCTCMPCLLSACLEGVRNYSAGVWTGPKELKERIGPRIWNSFGLAWLLLFSFLRSVWIESGVRCAGLCRLRRTPTAVAALEIRTTRRRQRSVKLGKRFPSRPPSSVATGARLAANLEPASVCRLPALGQSWLTRAGWSSCSPRLVSTPPSSSNPLWGLGMHTEPRLGSGTP